MVAIIRYYKTILKQLYNKNKSYKKKILIKSYMNFHVNTLYFKELKLNNIINQYKKKNEIY